MTSPAAASPPISRSRWSTWRKFRTLTVVVLLAGSALLNVLTLVSESVHAAAFGAVKAVTSLVVGEARATQVLGETAMGKFTLANVKRADAVKTVTSRVGRRLLMNSVRNVTSVAAEVVPFAGAAIVVAVTAWDVYDNCQTLKDLNELNVVFGHESREEKTIGGIKVPQCGGGPPPEMNKQGIESKP
ncbi:hypothetical protein [Variovorax rhizosphaerae]|uniref:Uncharacterized protein n=1 Tax=Variovorax rhizosphaerae TaxID=1836200 RepID=A0ABU8WGD4_9BURK